MIRRASGATSDGSRLSSSFERPRWPIHRRWSSESHASAAVDLGRSSIAIEFFRPADTWEIDTVPRAVLEPEQRARAVIGRHPLLDQLRAGIDLGERLHGPGRMPHWHERVEVGHDLHDPLPGDEPREVEPVAADIGDRAQRAASSGTSRQFQSVRAAASPGGSDR